MVEPSSTKSSKPPPGLLGAGIFATKSHAPILKKHPELFECIGVWSRRKESATALAGGTFGSSCRSFGGDDELDKLLEQVDAVVMALPFSVQPSYIKRVFQQGKHLLSEKPIAATVEVAKDLLDIYHKYHQKTLCWSVAENYRYVPGILAMAEAVKSKIGYV
jgi:predicted dehydrogenase